MPIFKLVQEMMFVNMCVKFHDNRLRIEVCGAVTPFQGSSPLLGGLHMTRDAHVRTHTRDAVCEQCVKFRHNWLRNEVCRAVMPLGHVRTNERTYGHIPLYPVRI